MCGYRVEGEGYERGRGRGKFGARVDIVIETSVWDRG